MTDLEWFGHHRVCPLYGNRPWRDGDQGCTCGLAEAIEREKQAGKPRKEPDRSLWHESQRLEKELAEARAQLAQAREGLEAASRDLNSALERLKSEHRTNAVVFLDRATDDADSAAGVLRAALEGRKDTPRTFTLAQVFRALEAGLGFEPEEMNTTDTHWKEELIAQLEGRKP
jgi:hypothetical protein